MRVAVLPKVILNPLSQPESGQRAAEKTLHRFGASEIQRGQFSLTGQIPQGSD
jgi:hypothetical protein